MGNNEQQVLQNNNDTSVGCSNHNNNNNNNNNNNVSIIQPTQGRYCHIVKRPDFDGYGFNLHSEKVKPGQYIGKVDAHSPAEAAGLREGDQIIEVNGVNIGSETHKQVVQRIKAIANEVRLLLLDPNEANKMQTNANEKTTANNKRNSNNSTASPKSQNKVTVQPNTPTTIETIAVGVPVSVAVPVPAPVIPDDAAVEQKEYITSISMISTTKAQTQLTIDTPDHGMANANGHNFKSNGNTMESMPPNQAAVVISSEPAEPVQRPNDNDQAEAPAPAPAPAAAAEAPTAAATAPGKPTTGLNLNLTAAEMRAKLLAKKKYDPKNESVDLKKKFEIIQKL